MRKLRVVQVICAFLCTLFFIYGPRAYAGWAGYQNGLGKGWASVNVRSSAYTTNKVITTNNMTLPGAAMPPFNYKTNAAAPIEASTNTYSRFRAISGGSWQGQANAAVGDGTDNLELQQRIRVTPADCAFLSFESKIDQTQEEFAANGNSASISITAQATGGTALWFRGFEFTGSLSDVPVDDPDTVENESIQYFKTHGVEKFETLVVGPFEFGSNNKCPLVIPFTLTSSNLEHLVYAVDGVALSLPLVLYCPPDVLATCEEPISYSPVQYAGCGEIQITYSVPPLNGAFPAGYFPVGVTPVTVTATDSLGHTTNCTFTVTVTDATAPTVPNLPTLTGEAMVTVPQAPSVTDNCGSTIVPTTTDPLTYTTQGTFKVRWTYDDTHGNVVIAEQTVVVDDVTAPVVPVLAPVAGNCSVTVTPPTTTDAVSGTITGTTKDPLTYNQWGTYTILWTFDDGNGNTSTASQTVTVSGLEFHGFYPPINGTGGTCSAPLRTANAGNNLPVKFDTTCGGLPISSGMPSLSIERSIDSSNPCGTLQSVGGGAFTPVGSEWHFNWDTTGQQKGHYKLTATLQDGSKQTVWIKLK